MYLYNFYVYIYVLCVYLKTNYMYNIINVCILYYMYVFFLHICSKYIVIAIKLYVYI